MAPCFKNYKLCDQQSPGFYYNTFMQLLTCHSRTCSRFSESSERSSCFLQHWYTRGTIFLFSGVMNARHRQSKLLYLTLQALYSPVLNRLNMQGSVVHYLKINKPNSKLSMALPPSLPFSIHLCQPDTILHFASWFSWLSEGAFCMSKTLLSFRLIPKELFCIKTH